MVLTWPSEPAKSHGRITWVWTGIVIVLAIAALVQVVGFLIEGVTPADIGATLILGLITLSRVVVLIALASIFWVPVGVWVGTRPRVANLVQPVAQFLAAFPANLLFPVAVSVIVALKLSPNIWLSPLMILGTQWYILFNVSPAPPQSRQSCAQSAPTFASAAGCGGGASRCRRCCRTT